MGFKAALKRRIQESGWYIRKTAGLPVGVDLFGDLRRFGIHPKCVLDIGAHHGQSAIRYAEEFPDARVFAFEPASSNFKRLMNATTDYPSIIQIRAAIGDRQGRAEIRLHPDNSEAHSLARHSGEQIEGVDVTTVDAFCASQSIRPDFIKIDTEGYELQVLKGSKRTLPFIKAILIEATLSSTNSWHIQISELVAALPTFGLAAIYDQCQWQTTGKLEFFNALFVNAEDHGTTP